MVEALYGVDVHAQYQSGLNIARLKQEGYSFLVTKASEGLGIPPLGGSSSAFKSRYLSWLDQARANGMVPGLYHWIRAGRGAEQARFFYGLVREAGGPAGMLIQLDCEDDASYSDVQNWKAEWEQQSGGHPFLLYTGKWWWGPRGWDGLAITPHLWHSQYLTADADTISDNPATFAARIPETWWRPGYGNWPAATIVQFTSRGDAGSLGNNVDLNILGGSYELLATLTGGDTVTAQEVWEHPIYSPSLLFGGTAAEWLKYTVSTERKVDALTAMVQAIAEKVDIDQAELEAISAAAKAGAEAGALEAAQPLAAALAEALKDETGLTPEQAEAAAERALRKVLGSVDDATPPA